MNIKTLLREEIQNEIEELKRMQVGTDEYRKTVEGIATLTKQVNDLENSEFEREDKNANASFDADLKLKQMKEDRRDCWIKYSIDVAGIVLPILVTIWGTKASFKFEEEGTITTTMGRGFINKLLPRK